MQFKRIYNNRNQLYIFLVYAIFAYIILDQNFLTLILSKEKNYDIAYIAFLELILQGATLILEIPSGIIGDFISRELILLGARISYILYSLIMLMTANTYMIVLAFILLGIAESLISGTEESIIAEIDDNNIGQMKKYMYFSGVVQISTIISILLGGYFVDVCWQKIYIVMIVAQSISAITLCFLIKKHKKIRKKHFNCHQYVNAIRKNFFNKKTVFTVLVGAGMGGGYSVFMIYLPLILSKIGLTTMEITAFVIIQMLVSTLILFIVGKMSSFMDDKFISIISSGVFLLGMIMLLKGDWLSIVGTFLCCISISIFFPAITSIINVLLTDEIRTTGNSIVNMIQTGFMCLVLGIIGFIFK